MPKNELSKALHTISKVLGHNAACPVFYRGRDCNLMSCEECWLKAFEYILKEKEQQHSEAK
jgi:hypothetical protein